MEKFILSDLPPEQHAKCQEKCSERSGPMLKCMNTRAIGCIPCGNIVHVACCGISPKFVPFLSVYFCCDCASSSDDLEKQMRDAENAAKSAYELSQRQAATSGIVSIVEYRQLQDVATKLQGQLKQKMELLNTQSAEAEAQAARLAEQEVSIAELKALNEKREREMAELLERLKNFESNQPRESNDFNCSMMSSLGLAPKTTTSTFLDRLNETVQQAESLTVPRTSRAAGHTTSNVTFNVRPNQSSRFNNTTFNTSRSLSCRPDYAENTRKASQMDGNNLVLVRSCISKPTPFTGDVTKWATFVMEFVRTSTRGYYRDFEDMDRLRELIQGEAREMFECELTDPCAEALTTLERLDNFFGVKGNAVQVALSRVTTLTRMEKPSDKSKAKILYTLVKQYALQCRIHKLESELASHGSLHIIESKMCMEHAREWRTWARNNGVEENIDGVIAYLEGIIRDLNMRTAKSKPALSASVDATAATTGGQESSSGSDRDRATMAKSYNGNGGEGQGRQRGKGSRKNRYADCECFLCRKKHPFYKCPQLIGAKSTEREAIVNKLHVCCRCLASKKHKVEECPNKLLRCFVTGCTVVNKHPLLHGHTAEEIPSFHATNNHVDVRLQQTTSHYAVIPGDVVAEDGSKIPITIMYDGGSGISLSTMSLFDRIGCRSHLDYELTLRWATSATHVESNAKLFDVKFIPQGRKKPVVLKDITAVSELELPAQGQDAGAIRRLYPHLSGVPLPTYECQRPQILIGLSHASYMVHLSVVPGGKPEDPVAALTCLGWVVFGNCYEPLSCVRVREPAIVNFSCTVCLREETVSTDDLLWYVKRCTDVDTIGISHPNASLLSEDDQRAEEMIRQTMKFVPGVNRYEIGLLWRNPQCVMPDNYREAIMRLSSSESRLIKLKMLDFVNQQFREQVEWGWLEEVTKEEVDQHPRRNYVYGFLTFNHNKQPPKPRWVNDTAAKFQGVSLNSQLLKGPDSLVPLPQSMLALREGLIAYQADVKAMFNQVLLNREDQFSQLCLWRDGNQALPPRIYLQTRVIFGPTCSPSITSAVRLHHAEKCRDEFPEASDVATHQMYVDDAPDSRESVKAAVKVARDLIEMFARIGWPLIQFQSNSQELIDSLPPANVSQQSSEVGCDDEEFITKVLGIFWKPRQDVYVYRLNDDSIIDRCVNGGYQPTKREMLSTVMRIFDPLGQIAPFRIRGHMIMQHVWRTGTDWKSRPPPEVIEEFVQWLRDFHLVSKLEIPRCYAPVKLSECELTLHVFVDAGTEAYAACVYLLAKHHEQIYVRLIAAKARVAPLKYMSIPRLELMSGLIGARLLNSVQKWHRRLEFMDYVCWTDSDVSYKWIRSPHLPRTAFSAPRIAEIQELTSADKWRYVPSKLNVADYATKERQIDYSDANHEWFVGPRFLYEGPDKWPGKLERKAAVDESKETHVMFVKPIVGKKPLLAGVITQIKPHIRANWSVYVRVVARALRFADYIESKRKIPCRTGLVTSQELHRAENYIFRLVQQAVYPEEYERLMGGQAIKKGGQLFTLSPYMCQETALIRATTRLSANFPLDMRRPIILPNFHEVTDAFVRHHHELNMHVGDNCIIASLRSRVWILNAKRAVRRCRARCVYCIERRAKAAPPDFADLPDFRLDIGNKPFYHTGCDLFGPFEVYTGRSKHHRQVWIVIFTCMVTRAVYFEVLDDMSTDCFLVAFEKLWSRRGPIVHVYSDNGRNFIGAAAIIEDDEFQKKLAERRIVWHNTPPYCPQFGGAWERLIKDVKRALQASIGKFTVPRLSMEAALAKIEANLNNRPLTQIPVSPNDDAPITPYLLMTGYPNYPVLDESSDNAMSSAVDVMKIKPARRVNALLQTFRKRFVEEYADVITRRPASREKAKYLLKEGDFVIYLDPTKNPSEWPRGILCRIYPGKDKKVRVADVKLPSGEIIPRRSVYRLAKLDFRLENDEAESDKYRAAFNVHFNFKSGEERESEAEKLKGPRKQSHVEMSRNINCRVFDDSTKAESLPLKRDNNVTLSAAERASYLDSSGERTIFVKNLPAGLGVSEIFTIMYEFGVVKTIASSSYDGVNPFNCIVTYSDPASVSVAMNANETQLITVDGTAHRTTFELLSKPFHPSKSIHKPIFSFVKVSPLMEPSYQVLLITPSETDKQLKRTTLPINGFQAGFINYCPASYRYDFTTMQVSVTNGAKAIRALPYVLKDRTAVATSSHNIHASLHHPEASQLASRSVSTEDGVIKITVGAPDPFESEVSYAKPPKDVDLRSVIVARSEMKKIPSVIYRPKRSGYRLRGRRQSPDSVQSTGGTYVTSSSK